ncbi:MAG: hypothetical protein AAFR61_23060 [Bacteroidota bacterium]
MMKRQNLKETFSNSLSSYYTGLISMIQPIVAAYMFYLVLPDIAKFDVFEWFMILSTFIILLIIWIEYFRNTQISRWVPNFLDSLIPYLFLASQMFAIHSVSQSRTSWAIGIIGIWLVAGMAFGNMLWRMRDQEQPFEHLIQLLKKQLNGVFLLIGFSALSLTVLLLLGNDFYTEKVVPAVSTLFLITYVLMREWQYIQLIKKDKEVNEGERKKIEVASIRKSILKLEKDLQMANSRLISKLNEPQ